MARFHLLLELVCMLVGCVVNEIWLACLLCLCIIEFLTVFTTVCLQGEKYSLLF